MVTYLPTDTPFPPVIQRSAVETVDKKHRFVTIAGD
jgi:hypothetical protein